MKKGKVFIIVCIVLMAFIGSSHGAGSEFPNKPIRILVGFGAGSATDIMLRQMALTAEKILGQSIIIESKPGGSGVLALELLKVAKPDGYTLVATADAPLNRVPHMTNVNYNPQKDFDFLNVLYYQTNGVVVKSDSPFKTFKDMIAYARKNPGKLTIAFPGVGTNGHLVLGAIAEQEKVKFELVPFQGSVPTLTAVLGGHVMSAQMLRSAFKPQVKAGALRAVLVFSDKRLEEFPEVPTTDDLGYGADVSNMGFTNSVIVAPKGVPKAVTDRLISAFSTATKTPEYRDLLLQNGMTVPDPPLAGHELDKYFQNLYELFGKFIKQLGLQKK